MGETLEELLNDLSAELVTAQQTIYDLVTERRKLQIRHAVLRGQLVALISRWQPRVESKEFIYQQDIRDIQKILDDDESRDVRT